MELSGLHLGNNYTYQKPLHSMNQVRRRRESVCVCLCVSGRACQREQVIEGLWVFILSDLASDCTEALAYEVGRFVQLLFTIDPIITAIYKCDPDEVAAWALA